MVLLVNADSDRFYHNLIRSGIARETYLKRLKNEGVDKAHHLASGRYQPLLDVIAAGDFGTGAVISSSSAYGMAKRTRVRGRLLLCADSP